MNEGAVGVVAQAASGAAAGVHHIHIRETKRDTIETGMMSGVIMREGDLSMRDVIVHLVAGTLEVTVVVTILVMTDDDTGLLVDAVSAPQQGNLTVVAGPERCLYKLNRSLERQLLQSQ